MNSSKFLKQSSLLMGFKQCNYGKERLFVSGWVLHWRPSTALSLVSLSKTYCCFFFVFAWTYLHLPLLQLFSPFFANPEPRFFLHSFSSCIFFAVLSDRHGVIQQVCMFPSHFPIALPHWPLSNHWPPSGWNIELGKLSAGIWQPHTPSWVQVRWNIKM